jgi:hypothetical protein
MNLSELAVVVKKGFQIPRWILDVQNGVNMVKNVLAPNEILNFFNSDNNKSYIIILAPVIHPTITSFYKFFYNGTGKVFYAIIKMFFHTCVIEHFNVSESDIDFLLQVL